MIIGFKGLHPITSFLFFVIVFVLTLVSSHPFFLTFSLIGSLLLDIRLSGKKAIKFFLTFLCPVAVLIIVFNGLFCHYGVTVLAVMKSGNNLTAEALAYGTVFAIRTVCALLWLNCFNEVITADKFIYLFGRFSPKTALIISMILRFIALFRQQYGEIELARRGIGTDSKSGNVFRRIKNALRSVSILITWALESAIDTAASMTSRGYGLSGRTVYDNFMFTGSDIFFSVVYALFTPVIFIGQDMLRASYNPVINISSPDRFGIFTLVIWLLLCVMPLGYDVLEEKLWLISKRKI